MYPSITVTYDLSMRKLLLPTLLSFALLLTGCYQARVTTGEDPGRTIEKKFASGFINGLATPGANIDAAECENGVAVVETQLSVPNMLVGAVTFGIYTPMDVRITCAASSSMSHLMKAPELSVPEGATTAEVRHTLNKAAQKSAEAQTPVQVKNLD